MNMYDKLGDLLNEALKSGEIPSRDQLQVSQEVKTAFESFGISMNFTYDEAKKIYHEKLHELHPDKNGSQEATAKLIDTWHILQDYYEGKKN